MLYHAFVDSSKVYGCTYWGTRSSKSIKQSIHVHQLELVKERAENIVSERPRNPANPRGSHEHGHEHRRSRDSDRRYRDTRARLRRTQIVTSLDRRRQGAYFTNRLGNLLE